MNLSRLSTCDFVAIFPWIRSSSVYSSTGILSVLNSCLLPKIIPFSPSSFHWISLGIDISPIFLTVDFPGKSSPAKQAWRRTFSKGMFMLHSYFALKVPLRIAQNIISLNPIGFLRSKTTKTLYPLSNLYL